MSKDFRDKESRNFGFGRKFQYASHKAIDWFYGEHDHQSTRHTHKRRIHVFTEFCYRNFITDVREIDIDFVEHFGCYVRGRIHGEYEWPDATVDSQISVSYAQNLISTVNTVLRIMRGDYDLKISPSDSVNETRTFTRQNPVEAQESDVLNAANQLLSLNMPVAAAVTLLAYAWGMRVREALLQDLNRMKREIAKTGSAAILEGCKGGRKSLDRTIVAGPLQLYALEIAMRARPTGSRNLLSETDTIRSVRNRELGRGRRILKQNLINSYRDLRAAFALEVYAKLTGGFNPMQGRLPERDIDRMARAEVSRMLGHNRLQVVNSYIGGY